MKRGANRGVSFTAGARPRHAGPSRGAFWAGLLGLLVASGCAGDLVAMDGGYRHRRHGYTIGAPGGPGPPWRRVRLDHAAIAYRRPGPETISLQSRCGRPVADPAIMARHLIIGVGERTARQAGPVLVDGRDGWSQTFDAVRDHVVVRVKTVTLVADGCTYDWILVTAGAFDDAERSFDAWWQTFHLIAAAPPEDAA